MNRGPDHGGDRWFEAKRKVFWGLAPRWDTYPVGRKLGEGDEVALISVYFSEFPNRIKVVDIFYLFGCNGDIVKVAISPRFNKFGKKFGFARFKEADDARLVVVRLDNIIIDGNKIHVNLPRFERFKSPVKFSEVGGRKLKVRNFGKAMFSKE